MSLCIIKYTYTRYVGVDIEKYEDTEKVPFGVMVV